MNQITSILSAHGVHGLHIVGAWMLPTLTICPANTALFALAEHIVTCYGINDHFCTLTSCTENQIVFCQIQTRVRAGLKIFLVAWFTMAMSLANATGDGVSSEGKSPIMLSIHDGTAGKLRCSIILAHFVTQSPVSSGRGFELTFDRDQSSGTLSERTSGGEMLVENIICGDKDAWSDTVSDIPLTLLRSSQSNYFVAYCQIESRLRCRVRAMGL